MGRIQVKEKRSWNTIFFNPHGLCRIKILFLQPWKRLEFQVFVSQGIVYVSCCLDQTVSSLTWQHFGVIRWFSQESQWLTINLKGISYDTLLFRDYFFETQYWATYYKGNATSTVVLILLTLSTSKISIILSVFLV